MGFLNRSPADTWIRSHLGLVSLAPCIVGQSAALLAPPTGDNQAISRCFPHPWADSVFSAEGKQAQDLSKDEGTHTMWWVSRVM